MAGKIETLFTPKYLTRAVTNVQKRKKFLGDYIPTRTNLNAALGKGGGDTASWLLNQKTVKRAKIQKRGQLANEVPVDSATLKTLLLLSSKEKKLITAEMRQLWQDPVNMTQYGLGTEKLTQIFQELTNRTIVGNNDALAEALRAGTITRTDGGVAVDFGLSNIFTLSTPWGTGSDDLTGTAGKDLLVNLIRPVTLASKLAKVGLVCWNSITRQYFIENSGVDGAMQALYLSSLEERGTVPLYGKGTQFVTVDETYTDANGAEQEYCPTGYIYAVAGVGPQAVPGYDPVYYEQGTPEFPADQGIPESTVGVASWIEELSEGRGTHLFVSQCETPIIADIDAVGSLYVL